MAPYIINIHSLKPVTHDVLQVITDKPGNLSFKPGQAADISIDKKGWENIKRSFTFASLPGDSHLEFVIKTYPNHKGVTNELTTLHSNDRLIIHDIFGSIQYKGEGLFIAGGAGVTPFISIFKDLKLKNEIASNKLIFANKTAADIILENEFNSLLGKNFINILSQENSGPYYSGFITAEFLSKFLQGTKPYIYLCGPPPMMKAIETHLEQLHISPEQIVKETF